MGFMDRLQSSLGSNDCERETTNRPRENEAQHYPFIWELDVIDPGIGGGIRRQSANFCGTEQKWQWQMSIQN
jgi:hypothetical protein